MVSLDENEVKKIKTGETIEKICLTVTAACTAGVCVAYIAARFKNYDLSYLFSVIAVCALCYGYFNIKNFNKSQRLISHYILSVCLENPQSLHPEREAITFYLAQDGCKFSLRANGFKDGLIFDFSAFNRLSPSRKASIANEIATRLTVTFCKLFEKGAKYKSVNYAEEALKKRTIPIIVNGVPEKRAYKTYLKNKR